MFQSFSPMLRRKHLSGREDCPAGAKIIVLINWVKGGGVQREGGIRVSMRYVGLGDGKEGTLMLIIRLKVFLTGSSYPP